MDGSDDRCEGEGRQKEREDAVGQIESEIAVLEEYLESMRQLGDESEEAVEMRSNVGELIELKRDQLLEWKKALLVERCEEQLRESGWRQDAHGGLGSIEYRYNNGRQGRRNVAIVAVGALGADSCPAYRGFWCQPVDRRELPCRQEMRAAGSCGRGDSCRYSHGLPLAPHDIGPPGDTGDCALSPGDCCLCLPPGADLWRPCRLVFVDPDAGSFVVELVAFLSDRSERVIAVTRDRLVKDAPLGRPAGDSDSEPDLPTSAAERLPPPAGAGGCSTFGDWERHTRGIGMKLLLKMGYTPNTGLGKHGQGRLNPIEVSADAKPTNRKKPGKTAPKTAVERSHRPNASAAENIKSSLARNEGELQGLQAKIESLERSKERHSGSKILTGMADKKIGAIRHRIGELKSADKILVKKLSLERSKADCDKPKKLKIF